MNPVLAIGVVLLVLGVSMALVSVTPLPAEARRKLVHVAMGLVTFTFPWLFASAWPVLLLGVLALGWFGAVSLSAALHARFGAALGERGSRGAFWFVCGVALTFVLSDGDAAAYGVAILVLTLADAAAALVGKRFGRTRKSFEGSTAFFVVAFLVSAAALQAYITALAVALAATVVEAAFGNGVDNLLVPLAVLAVLPLG